MVVAAVQRQQHHPPRATCSTALRQPLLTSRCASSRLRMKTSTSEKKRPWSSLMRLRGRAGGRGAAGRHSAGADTPHGAVDLASVAARGGAMHHAVGPQPRQEASTRAWLTACSTPHTFHPSSAASTPNSLLEVGVREPRLEQRPHARRLGLPRRARDARRLPAPAPAHAPVAAGTAVGQAAAAGSGAQSKALRQLVCGLIGCGRAITPRDRVAHARWWQLVDKPGLPSSARVYGQPLTHRPRHASLP